MACGFDLDLDHRTAITIHDFRDSFPVLKIHGCIRLHRNLSNFPFLSKRYKAITAVQCVGVNVNSPLQTVSKRVDTVYTNSDCMISQLFSC